MKKKEYQKPTQNIVLIKARQLLAGTPEQDQGGSQSRYDNDWDN